MCGIVGYTGRRQSVPVILDGLKKLEYRGYDSAGIAVFGDGGNIEITKAKGKLNVLIEKTKGGAGVKSTCGVGHTRWATHGEPSENNAHPHCNEDKTISAVHNGIIENYAPLKDKLIRRGYTFYSQTDTEVATKLVDYYYKKYGEPLRAISEVALHVKGSYALAVLFKDYPQQIFAIRKDSPMVIGYTDGEAYLASDVPAILNYTRNVFYIDNQEIAKLTSDGVTFYNLDREEIQKTSTEILWDAKSAEKDGWEHFMLKEIHEQPEVVKNTLGYFLDGNKINFEDIKLTDKEFKEIESIIIVGCGSAYHAGVVGQYVIEDLARIPVRVEIASEFRYRNPVLSGKELVVIISQSGETADSISALRIVKKAGVKTLAVVNVVGSTIAREADSVLYTVAGPEISVATTKAYSAQLVTMYMLAIKLAIAKGRIDQSGKDKLISELNVLPEKIEKVLEEKEAVQKFASLTTDKSDVFFIGRGMDYAVSIESSLKLKEISYIHSEAYPAGELKHGTISLIEDGTLVFGIITDKQLAEKTISNLVETKSRGAYIAVLVSEGINVPDDFDTVFRIPETGKRFSASLAVVLLQLFAYYQSVLRGNDVDKPRNLAKSVTVE